MQSQLVSPSPNTTQPSYPQTQSLYLPNIQVQPQPRSSQFIPQGLNNQNAFQFTNSYSHNPIITNEAYSPSQYNKNTANGIPNGSNYAINQSSLRQTRESKYKNKYSFKRNPAYNSVGPLTSSFNNMDGSLRASQDLFNEVTHCKAIINKQEFALARIRDIALNRRIAFDNTPAHSSDSIVEINALTEIYNLTLVNLNTGAKPLQFVEELPPVQFSAQPPLPPQIQNVSTFSRSYQPIYIQQVVPFTSQQNISSQVAVNNSPPQVIIASQSPKQAQSTFVPYSLTQQVKVEQKPIVSQQTTYEAPVSVLPPPAEPTESYKQSDFNRYEAYQSSFRKQSVPQPAETFKYQSYKPSYNPSSNEPQATTYQKFSYDYKSSYVPEAEPTSYNKTGNALNLIPSSQGGYSYESAQVRELKQKIEQLEQEKSVLIDKIRAYEKSNNFQNLNNNQTIENCQQEISKLKAQIAELTVIYNNTGKPNETEVSELTKAISILEDTIKQYQQQLIQAQNHIIFLQNNQSNEDIENFKTEIKYLRETIAKYTEHIEQMDIEKQKYTQEAHDANQYIQTLQNHIQENPAQGSGVSYEIYQNLIIEYGRKQLQVIILLEEINRLNTLADQLREHLEKAEEYIINIQQNKQNTALEEELASLKAQYHRTLSLIVQYEERMSQINEQNKSLRSKAHSKSSETHTKVGSAPSSFMDHQQYQHLLEQIKNREEQSIVLKQEIDKLNDQYIETRKHLENAEEFIIHLQQKESVQLEEQSKLVEQQQSRISLLQNTLKNQQFEKEQLKKRSLTFTAEYEDMVYRYKNALDELSKRYDELLQERNSLISKLSSNQTQGAITSSGPIISDSEVDNLRESLNNLNLQLLESKDHLMRAENYIESNVKNWEEASSYKEKHDQLQSFVAMINNDLETTKRQNEELANRLQSLEGLVADVDRLRTENEQLTIVVRQKDNTAVSTSLKQIDEVQEALNKYTHLYQESQERVRQLEEEKEKLVVKAEQLEEYLTRAESFIIQQEASNKLSEKNAKELSEQLLKAEEHIFALETEYNSLLKIKDEYQTLSRTEFERSTELHDALQKAEAHIFDLEAKLLKK